MKETRTNERRKYKKRRTIYAIYSLLIIALIAVSALYIYIDQTKTASLPLNELETDHEASKEISQSEMVEEAENEEDEIEMNTEPESEEIEVIFAGDTMFDWELRPLLEKKGYDYPFVYVKDSIKEADYSFINAETVFTENPGTKDPDQLFWINSDVRGLHAIENAGFTMINIGNNHSLDYMEPGLLDTIDNAKETNMEVIGAGKDVEEAYESKEVIIKGKKLRFFSFVRFYPNVNWAATENRAGVTNGYDLDLVKQTIEEQKGDADYVIVYFHWGIEQTNTPANYQKEYVKQLEEISVDLIVGSHPHWLQGFEYYNDMPVAYSIGNFLFPPYVSGRSAETGLLKAIFKGDGVTLAFEPYMIDNGQIIPVEEPIKQEMLTYLQSISFDVEIDNDGNIRNIR